jgi:hypothetical protein
MEIPVPVCASATNYPPPYLDPTSLVPGVQPVDAAIVPVTNSTLALSKSIQKSCYKQYTGIFKIDTEMTCYRQYSILTFGDL